MNKFSRKYLRRNSTRELFSRKACCQNVLMAVIITSAVAGICALGPKHAGSDIIEQHGNNAAKST